MAEKGEMNMGGREESNRREPQAKEKTEEDLEEGKGSSLINCMKDITIEPMLLLIGIGATMAQVSIDQMILYKTCMDPKFNLTDEFCSNIENYTKTQDYSDVEASVESFNNYISVAENLIPILLSFYLGSWSDHWGRRPFLYICVTGKLVASILNFVNAYFLVEWSRWVWLSTVMVVQNVTGGTLALIMVLYSFIADNSSPRARTMRMGFISLSWHAAKPFGTPLGAFIFKQGGYLYVFGITSALIFLGWSYMLLRLWNFKEKINNTKKLTFKETIHYRHITDSIKTSFKARPGHKRTYLLIMMLLMLLKITPYIAEVAFQFLYTKRFFQWDVSDYSWYSTVYMVIGSVGMGVLLPIFHYFKVNDNYILLIAATSMLGGNIIRGFSKEPWMFYLSAAVDVAALTATPPIRSMITRCVYPSELGKIFAMLASVECFVPISSTLMYTHLYTATRELPYPFSGACYFLSACFVLLAIIIIVCVSLSLSCRPIPILGEEGGEKAKLSRTVSNRHPDDNKEKELELFCLSYKRTMYL